MNSTGVVPMKNKTSQESTACKIRVSYCTTCHGRLWQLALTLFDNLDRLKADEEMVLVDYGSPDGLNRFVESSQRCRQAMEQGRLTYVFTEVKKYNCARAKNLAHRLARGDLLVNLEPDDSIRGRRRVIDKYFPVGFEDTAVQMTDGVRGKISEPICLPRYWFYRMGGFDESRPAGHDQGLDLIQRARVLGLRCVSVRIHARAPEALPAPKKPARKGGNKLGPPSEDHQGDSNIPTTSPVANSTGWGGGVVRINFGTPETYSPNFPERVSIVLMLDDPAIDFNPLLEHYNQMEIVGEIFVVNPHSSRSLEKTERAESKVTVVNVGEGSAQASRLAIAAQAAFPSVFLTTSDIWVPEKTLVELHKGWSRDSGILHGLINARPSRVSDLKNGTAKPSQVILSRGVLTTAADCFRSLSYFSKFRDQFGADETDLDVLHSCLTSGPDRRAHLGYRLRFDQFHAPKPMLWTRRKSLSYSAVARWCRENTPQASARARRRAPRALAIVATQKRREYQLRQMLPTLICQPLDRRIIYLNDYDYVPEWLKNIPEIEPWLHPKGDLGACAKFVMADQWDGYYFTMDDDILYPPDYCEKMIAAVERYDRQAIICAHANILHTNFTRYLDRHCLRFQRRLERDTPAHLGGSGTLAFHAPSLRVDLNVFPLRNLDDPQLGVYCQRHSIPIICIARPEGWMSPLWVDRGIWEDIMADDSQANAVLKSCESWRFHYPSNW
jgi:hypothetical protein